MRWTHGMRARLRLLLRGEAEARMDEELAFHLDMETEKNLREGMSPAEARRRALLAFGGVEGHKEALRDGRTFAWAGWVSLDLRLGVRMLRKYPGLTVIGGLAMAFAIWVGASTFEFLGQVARPTLPLPGGDRIVGIRQWDARASAAREQVLHDFVLWRDELSSIHDLGAFRTTRHNLAAPGVAPEPVTVAEMSASGFRVARVPALLGRTLVRDDERPGAPPVAVIGHDLWRTRFGGDAGIVGRTVRLGSTETTVVGVMPEGFAFPVAHGLWIPLRLNALEHPRGGGPALDVFGRLAPGASLREAQAELATLGVRAAADHPETHAHLRPRVMPYAESITGISGLQSLGLMSLNLFLLLLLVLVCGNVALLMFARAATREGEIVVRNALGASRGRIIVQLFTEALVLAGVAALVGLAAARFGVRLVHGLVENEVMGGPLPFWFDAGLSPMTMIYVLAITALAAVIVGVIPALQVTRGLGTRLRQATAGGGGFRFGGLWTGVIVTQVAVTIVFPVEAFVAQRDMAALRSARVGFAESEFLSARLEMEGATSPGVRADSADSTRAAALARYGARMEALERRLEADPAVAAVTFADVLPRMYHPEPIVRMDAGGAAAPEDGRPGHQVSAASVAIDFFDVLDVPILAGRGFDAGDPGSGARAVVVNQAFVRRVMGGRNPTGRRVRYVADGDEPAAADDAPWYEVVGVVADFGMSFGADGREAGVYHPVAPGGAYPVHLAVRVRGEPGAFAPRLTALATSVDPALQLHQVLPMDALSNPEMRSTATRFWLVVVVSAGALLLSLAGIYAVMAFTVAQRTREIGIRVALGADARRVVVAIFRRPLTQVVSGIVAGGVLTAVLPSMLGGAVTTGLVVVVATHMVLMMAVCLLACIVPTRRALRVEPMEALRAE
jgi:putative ABC transport system permease protein